MKDLTKLRVLLNDVKGEIFTNEVFVPFLEIAKETGHTHEVLVAAALVANAHSSPEQAAIFLRAAGL